MIDDMKEELQKILEDGVCHEIAQAMFQALCWTQDPKHTMAPDKYCLHFFGTDLYEV